MTRAFTPPDTLSKEEIRTIADVRRDIWSSAFTGLGVGSLSGLALHSLTQIGSRKGLPLAGVRLNRNTALFSFLVGGAVGSFLNAMTTGKNEVHLLHPIFQVGNKNQGDTAKSSDLAYKESLQRAQERSLELQKLEEHHHLSTGGLGSSPPSFNGLVNLKQEEQQLRRNNRMLRRKTLANSLERGQGLSDSHGGRWVQENGRNA